MAPIVVRLEEDGDKAENANDLSLLSCPSKAPRQEKGSTPIVDFFSSFIMFNSIPQHSFCQVL